MKARKLIPFILVLIFTISLFAACSEKEAKEVVIAEYTDDYLGVTYSIYKVTDTHGETFYAKVSGVTDNNRAPEISITIPSAVTYNETTYNVTAIGDLAFYKSNYDIIYIPEGVTTIEKFAFDRAKATRIDLPSTITSIGEYAFLDCVSLRDIYIAAIVPPQLGAYAFMVYDLKTNNYVNSAILNIKVPTTAKKRYTDINTYPEWEAYQGNIR